MSNAYLTWAAGLRGIKPADRSILMLIADQVREDGTWQIGIGELAARAEVARNTVRAMLDRLAARSLLAFKIERFRGEAQAAHRFMLIRSEEELGKAEAKGFSTRRQSLERAPTETRECGSNSDRGVGQKLTEVVGQNLTQGGSAGCPRVGQLSDPLSRPQNSPSKHVPPSDKSSGGRAHAQGAVGTQGELITDDDADADEPSQAGSAGRDVVVRLRQPKTKRARRVETPWPTDFALGDAERTYAEDNGYRGVDATRLWARFESHARSKGLSYVDWHHAWRNWVLNEVKFSAQRAAYAGARPRGRPPDV